MPRFQVMDDVYCIHNMALEGFVLGTFQRLDGTVWCVVENQQGNIFWLQEDKLRLHKRMVPLIASRA